MAVVGPSGAGKTSFLRAGFFPSAGPGWRIARCTPGTAPLTALREVLAAELSGDADVMRLLVRGDDADALVEAFTGWRQNHTQALLVIDQFEELFTLNPPDVQHAIAGILRRLVIEADIFVLLSFRDDFLARCREHEAFSSVFTDLTVLLAPTGAALRRALTQPALQCGYRFEDDELVEEMLAEVEGERGALPLLAFAAARLWERRDKESGLLTREAYQEIGGVGGALAQHAEATIDRIGVERIPIVRELFRNLVTAEGTRAVREWNELLSIFDDALRESAAEVLRELVDARLLTSYEVHEDEQEPTRRVEIIHESLLANWPRLVRWQTQDQEGAQLRDELRQAARAWDEHDRQDDRMWTGTAFREYQLWRERYPGGLTDLEEAFAAAMTSLATRRKRRRRIAAVVGVAVLLAVLAVVTGLWRRSVLETRRAEASKLLTLGHAALAEERTEALAYSIASLELSDIPEARRLALRVLWAGPPATAIPDGEGAWGLAFAPDGRQIAVGYSGGLIRVFPQRGGAPVEVHGLDGKGIVGPLRYSPDGRLLTGYASAGGPDVRIWETTGWQTERILPVPGAHGALGFFDPNGHDIITLGFHLDGPRLAPSERYGRWLLHRWAVDGEEPELIGMTEGTQAPIALPLLSRDVLAVGTRDVVALHHLETLGRKPGRLIARYPEVFALNSTIAFDPKADRLALADSAGHLDLWRLDGDGEQPEREIVAPRNPMFTAFSPDGSHLAYVGSGVRLWSLHGPISAEPLVLDPGRGQCNEVAFSPDGRWLVGSGGGLGLTLWPLTDRYSRILRSHEGGVAFIVFSPDGSRLITQGSNDGTVLAWDLSGGAGLEPVVLYKDTPQWGWGLAMDPMERFLIVGDLAGIRKVALDGTAITPIANFPRMLPELSPAGRLVAANVWLDGRLPTMVVLDLDTEERWEFDPPGEGEVSSWRFDPSGRLLMTRGGVLSRWNPSMNSTDVLVAAGATDALPLPDGRRLIVNIDGTRRILDLEDGSSTPLPRAHQPPGPIVLDSSGSIVVSGHPDGEIRVSSLSDENVHLLLGHDGFVTDLGGVTGRALDCVARGRRPAPLAHTRPLKAIASQFVPRRVRGQTESAHESSCRARCRFVYRLHDRSRLHRLPRLGRGAGVVKWHGAKSFNINRFHFLRRLQIVLRGSMLAWENRTSNLTGTAWKS